MNKTKIKINLLLILCVINFLEISAQNQAPIIQNVTFDQRSDGSHIVDIYYDVQNSSSGTMTVTMHVSYDNGLTWDFTCIQISGDVGVGITSGTNKHIVWNFGAEHPNIYNDQFRIKIIADVDVIMNVPCSDIPIITYQGKIYNTVQIGNQCWLKENLDVGVMITSLESQTDNQIIEKYCYDEDPNNCLTYGGLYQWKEAMHYDSIGYKQGICPSGWHIPTLYDYEVLKINVNADGNALKAVGQGIGAGEGTNTSGFSALLTGNSNPSGNFNNLGLTTHLWTDSAQNYSARDCFLSWNHGNITFLSMSRTQGCPVRCIKDEIPAVHSCPGIPNVTYAGKTYNTVQIGTQCWLKENLDVGVMIDSTLNQTNNSILEKYCYNDNPANCETYGGLYQWDEAMQYVTTAGTKGICPSGWHIPTFAELQTLKTAVNNDGNTLKAIGQGTGGGAGTNTSGFSALLAGYQSRNGYFDYLGHATFFWSSTEYNAYFAYPLSLYNDGSSINLFTIHKDYGFSVRCIKY